METAGFEPASKGIAT